MKVAQIAKSIPKKRLAAENTNGKNSVMKLKSRTFRKKRITRFDGFIPKERALKSSNASIITIVSFWFA